MLVNLSIAGQSLRTVKAQKVGVASLNGRGDHDALYDYEWKINAGSRTVALGVIRAHRYGDGPLVLLQKILAAAKLEDLPERKR